MKPEFKKKSIRSFVIRAGRITESQKKAFDHWWPKYGLSLFDGELNTQETFEHPLPLVVEVGFGMGDSLADMAKHYPQNNYVGIEVHPPGVGRLINRCGEESINNVRAYMADAVDVLTDCFAENSIDRLQLFFPDPWHKKKHNKRRIVQPEFAELVRTRLTPGGKFHMATDWAEYAEYMMEVMSLAPGYQNDAGEYQFIKTPDYRAKTKFERRGERLGHGVWDLIFSKV